jgi:hypothetical protein
MQKLYSCRGVCSIFINHDKNMQELFKTIAYAAAIFMQRRIGWDGNPVSRLSIFVMELE